MKIWLGASIAILTCAVSELSYSQYAPATTTQAPGPPGAASGAPGLNDCSDEIALRKRIAALERLTALQKKKIDALSTGASNGK